MAKLREANVLRIQDVRAVVLETTGDISVLHGSQMVDAEILEDIRRGPSVDNMHVTHQKGPSGWKGQSPRR